MLLSIIIPCYNVEKSVKKTLDSWTMQDFDDYEIIAVDDGSTDGTRDVIYNCKACIDRIRIIEQKNEGVSSARNNGLRNAKGDYIMFLDADDYVTSDFFENIIPVIKDNHKSVVVFGYHWSKKHKDVIPHSNGLKYLRRTLLGLENPMIWSYVAKRSVYEKWSLLFDRNFAYAEDYHLFIRLFYLSLSDLYTLKKPFVVYTDNELSAMHKPISWKSFTSCDAFRELEIFFEKHEKDPFYKIAMKNIQIQNYIRLYRRAKKDKNNYNSVKDCFEKYSYLINIRPPFQLNPFYFYNIIFRLLLFRKIM